MIKVRILMPDKGSVSVRLSYAAFYDGGKRDGEDTEFYGREDFLPVG